MPQPAGQLVDLLLGRVRDRDGIATTRAFVRRMISDAQRLVNLESPGILDVCRMPTHAGQVVYDLTVLDLTRGDLVVDREDVARVDAIRSDGRDLVRVDWKSHAQGDRGWIRTTAPQHRVWSRLGRDLLFLSPARDVDGEVTLVYVTRTPFLASDDTVTVVRDDRLPAVLALAESLILLHRRLYPAALSAMQTMEARLAGFPKAGGTGQASFFAAGGTGP